VTRYDNGELVTKDRIQDEEWYPDYQEVMQFICENPSKSVEEVYEYFVGRPLAYGRFLRWIVLHIERNKKFSLNEDRQERI
jgi:hypothetical protein